MKILNGKGFNPTSLAAFGLLVSGLCLTGCATKGYTKADTASRSLQTAAMEVQSESRALELAVSTLNNLVNQPAIDLKPQFVRFTKAVDRLEATAVRNERAAAKTAEKHAAYFESWNRELTNMNYEVVRTRSEARKKEVSEHYDNVSRRYNEARAAMQPMIQYLVDIQKALGADLTQGGLQAVKPIVVNANENAGKVQLALAKLSDELHASSSSISSTIVQTATASEPGEAQSLKR